ncbi:MAG TPA: hypothetical protein VIY48_04510 [Candidatus Paceibacterota bacterium]
MGGIDLDPCSEAQFNEVIKATKYYSLLERGEDGLKLPWFGKVWLNPPGEERNKPRLGLVRAFWEKLFTEDVEQAIYVGFSMEQLGQLADASVHPSDFSICYLRNRLHFNRHDGNNGSPTHSNFICGINVFHDSFEREFKDLGKVQRGPMSHGYNV